MWTVFVLGRICSVLLHLENGKAAAASAVMQQTTRHFLYAAAIICSVLLCTRLQLTSLSACVSCSTSHLLNTCCCFVCLFVGLSFAQWDCAIVLAWETQNLFKSSNSFILCIKSRFLKVIYHKEFLSPISHYFVDGINEWKVKSSSGSLVPKSSLWLGY